MSRRYSNTNEWELAIKQSKALEIEDYETCKEIKEEIDFRIKNKTINKSLMHGFRFWNPITNEFEGEPNYGNVNGLFDSTT
ncbi:hypothetical protein [Polaribacter sp. IC073]|uniref:hypothetical protein n=1 Tax=Polaribacter sp. IC073 TaxID=2508540 RepID=UPI0011BE66F5|nr:hypothetical protein [Polaribacter sp. IC073]TXD47352.1 hypothetical protein ES045_12200 [Polaribacter sp. IC073]